MSATDSLEQVTRTPMHLDPTGKKAFEIASTRYQALLSPKELKNYRAKCTTMKDVLSEVKRIEAKQRSKSTTRRLSARLNPFLRFLEQYAVVVDVMVQAGDPASALIWGTCRAVLKLASGYSGYLEKLVDKMEGIGDKLPIFEEYEQVLSGFVNVEITLANIYFDIFEFLHLARKAFNRRGFRLLARSIWGTFETDFGKVVARFERNRGLLAEHIKLANAQMVKSIAHAQQLTTIELSGIKAHSYKHLFLWFCRCELAADEKTPVAMMFFNGTFSFATEQKSVAISERRQLMQWVYKGDVRDDFLRESRRRVVQSSGQWLLKSNIFQNWLQSEQPNERLLRIVGYPGSGKTVLSTVIIDEIEKMQKKNRRGESTERGYTTYFYCSKADQNQDTLTVLAGLIKQTLSQLSEIPDVVTRCHQRSANSGRSAMVMADNPKHLLEAISEPFPEFYIVIDGWDEIADPGDVIKNVLGVLDNAPNTRILLLSREVPEVNKQIAQYPTITLTLEMTRPDIDDYLKKELKQIEPQGLELHQKLFDKLSRGAEGMFLWASLMTKSLKMVANFQDAVDIACDVPAGLDEYYISIMKKFIGRASASQIFIRKVLSFMSCAYRPLRLGELRCLLAHKRNIEGDEHVKLQQSAVVGACYPLIKYLQDRDIFRFSHASVRDFLLNNSSEHRRKIEQGSQLCFREADGHLELADVCLSYMLRHGTILKIPSPSSEFPLADYAMSFWGFHVVRSKYDHELAQKMHDYLSSQPRRVAWITRQLFKESSGFPLQHLIKMQKRLQDWGSRGYPGNASFKDRLDWIRDIGRILLGIDEFQRRHEQLSASGSTSDRSAERPASGVTYFDKLMVVRDLSREYTMRGWLDEGEQWMIDALEQRVKKYGADHLSTAWLRNSLGIIYDQQGKSQLAAETQEAALSIQEHKLGPAHLETVWTINELGRVYRHLKRHDKAIAMHQTALARLKGVLPDDDLQLAWTFNTIARALRESGDPRAAMEYHQEGLTIQTNALGSDHPHVLWTTADIAKCYRDQGDLKECARLHRNCLTGRMQVLGPDHLDTCWAMNNLGLVLEQLGEFKEAKELHERALDGQVRALGISHEHAMWSNNHIKALEEKIEEDGRELTLKVFASLFGV